MKDYMCLIRQDEHQDWYMLCVKDTFLYCVSAGPLDMVLEAARKVVKRYGTAAEYSEALHGMEGWPRVEPLHSHTLQAVYDAQEHRYDKVLLKVIKSTYSFSRPNVETAHKKLSSKATSVKKRLMMVAPSKKEVAQPTRKKVALVTPKVAQSQSKVAHKNKLVASKKLNIKGRLRYEDDM